MLIPMRFSMLNYFLKVDKATINDVMDDLKTNYGSEKQYNKKIILDHIMSMRANGLIEDREVKFNEDNSLYISYKITDLGKNMAQKYISNGKG